MNINSAFPSKFLKASDLSGRATIVTIDSVGLEDVGDGEPKPVLYFQGKSKGLVLNKTNALTIAEIAKTDEMDDWGGVQVMIFPTKTQFQGKRVDCLRVDYPKGNGAAKPTPPPAQDNAGDDDIPF